MPSTLEMDDKQHTPAGITIKDQDGQPFASLPADHAASFVSSDPTVADFVVGPDGMNGDITSGKVGSATITATVTKPDGSTVTDYITVAVKNTPVGEVNFTAGVPIPE